MFSDDDGVRGSSRGLSRRGLLRRSAPLESGRRSLDRLLGGGIPRGQVVEVSGARSSGKATLGFGVCLRALEQGQAAAWIDAGGGFWPVAAAEAGISLDRLLVVRAAPHEQPHAPNTRRTVVDRTQAHDRPSAANHRGALALKAARILLSSPGAVAALVVDLPLGARAPRDRELVALQRLAERSATALLFLTERPRTAPSLGAQVALRLFVERRGSGPGAQVRVEVLRNKQGASGRAIEEAASGPDRLRGCSSL